MRTFIFGAGASHSYTTSPSGVRPPLAKGFFDAYNELLISEDRYVLIGFIINYVRVTRGVDAFHFNGWSENIEDFLTEIDDRIGTSKAAQSLPLGERILYSNAYNQMLFLFASVLNEIQNGPASGVYASFLESLQDNDALITFNWDTLLDRVLYESGEWRCWDGYGLSFQGFFLNGWTSDPAKDQKSRWQLLKLHGSTNWLMPYRVLNLETGERVFVNPAVDPSTRPMYCFIQADNSYPTYMNRSKSGYQPFSYYYYPPDIPIEVPSRRDEYVSFAVVNAFDLPEHGTAVEGGFPFSSMPLIIAPVRNKEYSLLGNALDPLWEKAEKAIVQASELAVIGYSFPLSDIRPWQMMRRALEFRSTPLTVTVIDPSPDALAQRLRNSFGSLCTVTSHRCTFENFLGAR